MQSNNLKAVEKRCAYKIFVYSLWEIELKLDAHKSKEPSWKWWWWGGIIIQWKAKPK